MTVRKGKANSRRGHSHVQAQEAVVEDTTGRKPAPYRYGHSRVASALFASDHAGHDVGWRHEDGRLFSATCHDCGATYAATDDDVST